MNTSPLHTSRKASRVQRIFFLAVAILLFTALFSPVVAARDVRVALPELRPSVFTNDQGEPAGLFVEIIQDIARREGWNIIWVKGSLQESWTRLATGEIDLLMGVAETPERQALYDFNHEPVLSAWSQIYTRPGSGINTILDLEGKRIAMLRGDVNGIEFRDYAKKFDINATYLEKDTLDEAFAATAAGEADAIVGFSLAGEQSVNKYGLADTSVMFNPSSLLFAVPKGTNQDILLATDRYLAEGKADPSSVYSSTMQKWFGMKGTSGIIPAYILWGIAIIAGLAGLFVIMSVILRREVRKKTAELSRQNVELQAEVAKRKRTEAELSQKNEDLQAAYEELATIEEELRFHYQELGKSEQALRQARKKLNVLNTLTFQDIQSGVFALNGYMDLAKRAGSGEALAGYLGKAEATLLTVRNSLRFAKKYQDMGMSQPRWHDVNYTLIYAISHLDFSRISRTVALDGLEIYADPLLENVFLTVMENMVVHTAGATKVSVTYRNNTDKSITVLIEDDGPGIPAADKEKIFGRGYQKNDDTSLFLAREILSITDITITETGEPGAGSRFEIRVPEGKYRFGEP
ncbi:MAG: transporter substrate-binding domain-containing protein [Methanoregula sp.]|nr:transporter substrate-binding domain-containing protein [Methanoregula sp.]